MRPYPLLMKLGKISPIRSSYSKNVDYTAECFSLLGKETLLNNQLTENIFVSKPFVVKVIEAGRVQSPVCPLYLNMWEVPLQRTSNTEPH